MPSLGFGTFDLRGETCREAVRTALRLGYRHIDTARMYGNETEIGAGIREERVNRSDIFITTKVWHDSLRPDDVRQSVDTSLRALGTDYLDLVLIHWPNSAVPVEDTLGALEELKEQGVIRNVGVSNFPSRQLRRALLCLSIFCNQVEYHPFLEQEELLRSARANDLLLVAYCPLAQGGVAKNPVLRDIAKAHGKTPQQVALRWLVEQENVAAVPRSSDPLHIAENRNIFDFELGAEERERIAALPKGRRLVDPDFAPEWD